MTNKPTLLGRVLFFATCFTVGCTGGGMAGCGSSDGAPAVDSNLPGVYQVTAYRFSEDGCDGTMTADGSLGRFVLYGTNDEGGAVMAGGFCADVEGCRTRATVQPATVNYSFFEGSDTSGWRGWGIAGQSMVGEMCQIAVQTHDLTSLGNGAIRIDTRQVETLFTGEIDPDTNVANCTARDAVANVQDDSPCQALFVLDATFETGL